MNDLEEEDLETLESILIAEQEKTTELSKEHRNLEFEVQKITIQNEQKEEYLISIFNKKIKKLKEQNATISLWIQKEEGNINKLEQQYQESVEQRKKLLKTISTHEGQVCPDLEEQIKNLTEELERIRSTQIQKDESENILAKLKDDLEGRKAICESELCDCITEIENLINYNNSVLEQISQFQEEPKCNSSEQTLAAPVPIKGKRQNYSSLPVKKKKRKTPRPQ